MKSRKGFAMDRWATVAIVLLVVGLVVLTFAVVGMRSDVLARGTVVTDLEHQLVGPIDLPGGSCTIWLEDHELWPDDPRDIDVGLNRGNTNYWGSTPEERRYQDIEGTRCFLVVMLNDAPAGEWNISVELLVEPVGGSEELGIFVLSSPGPLVLTGFVGGVILIFLGVATVAVKRWPGK